MEEGRGCSGGQARGRQSQEVSIMLGCSPVGTKARIEPGSLLGPNCGPEVVGASINPRMGEEELELGENCRV